MSICPCGDEIHVDDLRDDLKTWQAVVQFASRKIEELERKVAEQPPCTGFQELLNMRPGQY